VEEQQFNLREGAEIIIATPGRLKDVLERHVLVLSQCRYVVMDEADRMVHLGFEADLTYILDQLPSETMEGEDQSEQMDVDGETMVKKGRTRVTTLFSATMPPPVERLARKYLKRPAIITIGEAGRAVDTVEQRVEFVTGEEKKKCVVQLSVDGSMATEDPFHRQRLVEILNSGQYQAPIIVFVNQKKTADMVAKDLTRAGVRRGTLHDRYKHSLIIYFLVVERGNAALWQEPGTTRGFLAVTALWCRRCSGCDRPRWARHRRARRFACHQFPDVWYHRGLRTSDRFDIPFAICAIVTKLRAAGRTGRAGKQGTAITFLSNDDDEVMCVVSSSITVKRS
jgi:ATP-dependent RNA helicase DDX23/PRP28